MEVKLVFPTHPICIVIEGTPLRLSGSETFSRHSPGAVEIG
jgi:hypothetical protein